MARSRNIKPGFFKNEILGELPFQYRLLFIGLWTHADREGRCEYRPRRIKAELFPYDETNVEDGIAELAETGFLTVYDMDGTTYIQIRNWAKHQAPHHKEVGSTIPGPPGHVDRVCPGYIPLSNTIRRRIYERDGRKCRECGAEHGLSIDHIVPITKGGNSTDDNLQVLCLGCNARKGNRILRDVYVQAMHEPCMTQASAEEIASSPTDSLIPDSLIPDSLIPSKAPAAPEDEGRFADWWAVYPKHVKRKAVAAIWKRRKLDAIADRLIADVLNRIANDDGWKRGYIPDPTTYLNQDRWHDEVRAAPVARAGPQQQSKTLTGMHNLQGMKNGLVHQRDHRRPDEADVLGPGPDACRRLGSDHGGDVD